MNQMIDKLGGIEAFGIFSICLFVAVFTASIVLAFCLKKPFLRKMSALPLEDQPDKPKITTSHPL
jgi:hypothetical protein